MLIKIIYIILTIILLKNSFSFNKLYKNKNIRNSLINIINNIKYSDKSRGNIFLEEITKISGKNYNKDDNEYFR